jgi:hypothetical protein
MAERECYWREAATGGHNRAAYYLGTMLSEIYRLFLTSFHFAIVAYFMWEPLQSFWEFFVLIFLLFVAFDSQSIALSMVLRPSSAPLMVTVAGVFVSLLNGYPTIPYLSNIGFTYYMTEALIVQELAYTNDIFKEPLMQQYDITRLSTDYAAVVIIIVLYRVIGFALMKFTNRDKQR